MKTKPAIIIGIASSAILNGCSNHGEGYSKNGYYNNPSPPEGYQMYYPNRPAEPAPQGYQQYAPPPPPPQAPVFQIPKFSSDWKDYETPGQREQRLKAEEQNEWLYREQLKRSINPTKTQDQGEWKYNSHTGKSQYIPPGGRAVWNPETLNWDVHHP